MSLPDSKIVIAAAAGLALVAAAVLWLTGGDEDPASPQRLEATAPMDAPTSWADADIDRQIRVDIDGGPIWQFDDQPVMEGPTPLDADLDWQVATHDGWTVLVGDGEADGIDVRTRVWTAPGFPQAIIDVQLDVPPKAAARALTATTTVHADEAHWLDDRLDSGTGVAGIDGAELSAARFATAAGALQIHSPHGAVGTATDTGAGIDIDWMLWPGIDGLDDCDGADIPAGSIHRRLMVSLGDHPVVTPAPIPHGATSLTTPIFIDPAAESDQPWADGRARDADELARRFRALAFGHSNRDDPRYGNGGLLAADMGAVFVVPADWWEDPAIQRLRRSLDDTPIEVVADDATLDDAASTLLADAGLCDAANQLFSLSPAHALVRTDGESPHRGSMTAPPAPVIHAGIAPIDRHALLDRLFVPDTPDGLIATGEHRVGFIPVVATRNPLESISAHKILSPDNDGHWNLHDELIRRLTRLELTPDGDTHRMIGLQQLAELRKQTDALAWWTPDGELKTTGGADQFWLFGDMDHVEFDGIDAGPLSVWNTDVDDAPVFTGDPAGVMFEFEPVE